MYLSIVQSPPPPKKKKKNLEVLQLHFSVADCEYVFVMYFQVCLQSIYMKPFYELARRQGF